MGNLFAHKSFLVSVNRAEEDQMLYTIGADIPIQKGELFLTDQSGQSFPITEQRFKDNYVPVEKKKVKVNLDEMARGYMEMGALVEESNNEDYIFEPKLTSNKTI